jgi:hypothetical protein
MLNNYLLSHGASARLSWVFQTKGPQNAVIWTANAYSLSSCHLEASSVTNSWLPVSGIPYGNATGQTKGIAQEKAAQETLLMLEYAERRMTTSLAHQSSP